MPSKMSPTVCHVLTSFSFRFGRLSELSVFFQITKRSCRPPIGLINSTTPSSMYQLRTCTICCKRLPQWPWHVHAPIAILCIASPRICSRYACIIFTHIFDSASMLQIVTDRFPECHHQGQLLQNCSRSTGEHNDETNGSHFMFAVHAKAKFPFGRQICDISVQVIAIRSMASADGCFRNCRFLVAQFWLRNE